MPRWIVVTRRPERSNTATSASVGSASETANVVMTRNGFGALAPGPALCASAGGGGWSGGGGARGGPARGGLAGGGGRGGRGRLGGGEGEEAPDPPLERERGHVNVQ